MIAQWCNQREVLTHFVIERALFRCDRSRFPRRWQFNFHQVVTALLPLACTLEMNRHFQHAERQTQNINQSFEIESFSVCRGCITRTSAVLTHVVEMLPESLHPPVCVLATVCGQRVCDLLASVLVAHADILNFTLRVFLWRTYPGLLKTRRRQGIQSSATKWLQSGVNASTSERMESCAATSDHYSNCNCESPVKISPY